MSLSCHLYHDSGRSTAISSSSWLTVPQIKFCSPSSWPPRSFYSLRRLINVAEIFTLLLLHTLSHLPQFLAIPRPVDFHCTLQCSVRSPSDVCHCYCRIQTRRRVSDGLSRRDRDKAQKLQCCQIFCLNFTFLLPALPALSMRSCYFATPFTGPPILALI
jgi:hypothetical protein